MAANAHVVATRASTSKRLNPNDLKTQLATAAIFSRLAIRSLIRLCRPAGPCSRGIEKCQSVTYKSKMPDRKVIPAIGVVWPPTDADWADSGSRTFLCAAGFEDGSGCQSNEAIRIFSADEQGAKVTLKRAEHNQKGK
jgi:hypothetical protein